jgi:hypothetical protein
VGGCVESSICCLVVFSIDYEVRIGVNQCQEIGCLMGYKTNCRSHSLQRYICLFVALNPFLIISYE